jgi:uncharacterized protein CbrC (UPF0167 family)
MSGTKNADTGYIKNKTYTYTCKSCKKKCMAYYRKEFYTHESGMQLPLPIRKREICPECMIDKFFSK